MVLKKLDMDSGLSYYIKEKNNYFFLSFMFNKVCIQHHPIKLSTKAIHAITAITIFIHAVSNCGCKGPSHQNANINLKTLSNVLKFCFIYLHFICD